MNNFSFHTSIPIEQVVFDSSVYPREKWSTSTIERYADAIEAGAVFPPIVLEAETNRLLDGKHRLEAHKKAGRAEIAAEWRTAPDGMTVSYFAASLSSAHGDRLSNGDIKRLAETEFEANPKLDPEAWGSGLGVPQRTVYRWVSHILERGRTSRANAAWHLTKLGWSQEEIATLLGVTQGQVSLDIKNCHLAKINSALGEFWNEKGLLEAAKRLDLPLVDCYAAVLDGKDDAKRMDELGIKVQPYDVWNFSRSSDMFGRDHPGRIPGELIAHVLYFYTDLGDVVVDPMVGGGTTLDVCLTMGRKCYGFDIDQRHERTDVIQHDILKDGWHERTKKADLVFWDPPYFDKMDSATIGADGYIDGSISKLGRDEYLDFFNTRLQQLRGMVRKGTRLAFLMSDWDDDTGKRDGIFVWNYANMIQGAGWKMVRHIQAPLSTQQVHPDIVEKFRASRRLARLERYLLIAEA